jgi:hypothetical protein
MNSRPIIKKESNTMIQVEINIKINGETDYDIAEALTEAYLNIKDGCTHGFDRAECGNYEFRVKSNKAVKIIPEFTDFLN